MLHSVTNQIAEGETLAISHGDQKWELTLMMETGFGIPFYKKIIEEKSFNLNGTSMDGGYILFEMFSTNNISLS